MSKVWFITGASRGFGRLWAEGALARGDRVAATARGAESLLSLSEVYGDAVFILSVDVTDRRQVEDAIEKTHLQFGRIDIVVNNAGYALVGTVEEISEPQARKQFDTNFFGPLNVIQAALPFLRGQGGGHIIGVSSVAGIVAGPVIGLYHASKWAFEALHESLAKEISAFGINVTLLEPGAFATGFSEPSSTTVADTMDVYAAVRASFFGKSDSAMFGDPVATLTAVLKVVDAQAPPLRLFLGVDGLPAARMAYEKRLCEWEAWNGESVAAQGRVRGGADARVS